MQGSSSQEVLLRGVFSKEAVREAGAPAEVWIRWGLGPREEHLFLDITWVRKNATRLPEVNPSSYLALFLRLTLSS